MCPNHEPSPTNDLTAGPTLKRHTRQYRSVLAVLDEFDDFRSAQEIHAELHLRGQSVARTTVYRILHGLVAQDQVDVVWPSSGDALYRRCGAGHHHHLRCRSCGEVIEVSGPDVEEWAERVAGWHGFTEVDHSLEIVGTCSACAQRL